MRVGQKAKDLRNWLTVYSYWNQGGQGNVVSMFAHLVDQYFKPTGVTPAKLLETPATGSFSSPSPPPPPPLGVSTAAISSLVLLCPTTSNVSVSAQVLLLGYCLVDVQQKIPALCIQSTPNVMCL